MPRLVIQHSGEESRVFELVGERPVSIGRAKSSNLMLDDPGVSRLHAVVRVTPDGQWQIVDRGSVNGLRINGQLTREATLRPNDEVLVGEYKLRYEDSASRNVVTYGTAELPRRFAQILGEPAYSGSFMRVEPIGDAPSADSARPADRADRVNALERENRLLTLLYRVNQALGESRSIGDVTQRALDLALEIDGAERGYAMLLDADSMDRRDFTPGNYAFEPAVIRHRAKTKGGPNQAAPQLVISQSIIRQAMQGGMPLLITDAQTDARLAASSSVALSGIRSAMCAPLGIGDRRRGLLYVDNLSKRGMFTVDDLNVFAVIAVQAGLAIDRVRNRPEVPEPARG